MVSGVRSSCDTSVGELADLAERILQAGDHLVEGLDERCLVRRCAPRVGNAQTEVRARNSLSGLRHFEDWGEATAGKEPSHQAAGKNDERDGDDYLDSELVEQLAVVIERNAHVKRRSACG